MTSGQKKFAYGLFYLIIIALAVWAFWPSAEIIPPACSGPSCGTGQPLPLQTQSVGIFGSASARRAVALASVSNPNKDFGFNFSYEFRILDKNGGTTAVIPGNEAIYPSETKYLLGVYDAGQSNLADVADKTEFAITSFDSVPASNFLKPDLILSSGPSIRIEADGVSVSATVKNRGSFPAQNVKAVVIVNNKYGDPIFAAQTLLREILGFSESSLLLSLPADDSIVKSIDIPKTEVFLSAE
jgi:hypothetical protein